MKRKDKTRSLMWVFPFLVASSFACNQKAAPGTGGESASVLQFDLTNVGFLLPLNADLKAGDTDINAMKFIISPRDEDCPQDQSEFITLTVSNQTARIQSDFSNLSFQRSRSFSEAAVGCVFINLRRWRPPGDVGR